MCDLTGCDLQIAVFLSLLLFWCTKQQTTSPRSHHTPRRQQTPPFTRRRHLPHQRYNQLHHSPFSEHRAVTTYAGRMGERRGHSNNLPPKRPRKISRPKLPRKPSLIKLIPLKIRSEERKGEGWRVVSRLAGARMRRRRSSVLS